ncbi:MAG: cation-translocating P-type ATPase [Ruminococcaceae bacterium]|nr:cation-translocating P-type ATPase [Oscillospiraceae bacterium]
MENIDNMGRNSLEALSRDNLTDLGRKKLTRDIICGVITLTCLACGLFYTYVLKGQHAIVPQLLYFIGVLIEGVPVLVAGLKGIFTKNLTNAMEILVGIAVIACVFNRELILALLIPLILNVVHLLEERSIMGGRDVIEGLKKMQQTTAILLENGTEREVDVKDLHVGQEIVIKPGAGIPIDGVVLLGETDIDQKSLTGEPQPARAAVGDTVYAGTVNLTGRIVVRVAREHVDTSFSKILKVLEESEGISVPESRLTDRFLGYYIPFVLAVAGAVALISADIAKAIAILVVSCPCGQMLVSSAPMIAALSVSTKRGILIKNSKFIEELTEIDTVVFDKTGTVTCGELSLDEVLPFGEIGERELLLGAAALAVGSNHPVSRAVSAATEHEEYAPMSDIREISGGGVEGVADDGKTVFRFGRCEWLCGLGIAIPENFPESAAGSVSYVSRDGVLLGALCFNDTVRENAAACVAQLRALGAERTVMLTGDREEPALAIGEAVGLDEVHARLLPEDKLAHLQTVSGEAHNVLAIGDGINDALILREADVGIAMGAMGSDLAIDSADIALMNNNLMNIPFVVSLACETRRVIYQNLVLSIGITAVMMTLSAFGVISALAGTVLHNFGAFAVLLNSSRILRKK